MTASGRKDVTGKAPVTPRRRIDMSRNRDKTEKIKKDLLDRFGFLESMQHLEKWESLILN